jgi:SAM-dependent methyltransferase
MRPASRLAEDAGSFKACCADLYGSDHPGGRELTRRLAAMGDLRPGDRMLDVASGPGDSATLLADEFGVRVHGIDRSPALVARAAEAAGRGPVSFSVGDAEALALDDGTVDAVLCECALCTFPDKQAAARGFARVLAPGGRLLLSDVVVNRERLPGELDSLAGWVACLAGALSLDDTLRLLEDSGLRVCGLELHGDAVVRMAQDIDARLALLGAMGIVDPADLGQARRLARSAVRAVEDGGVGYALITAEIGPAA